MEIQQGQTVVFVMKYLQLILWISEVMESGANPGSEKSGHQRFLDHYDYGDKIVGQIMGDFKAFGEK